MIEEAIKEYNKYHSPEANAELVALHGKSFEVKFTGSFCVSCGFYDYFDDYTIVLDSKGLKTEIAEINEIEDGAIVKFEVAASPRENK